MIPKRHLMPRHLVLAGMFFSPPALAGELSAPNACFTPAEIVQRANEQRPVKGVHTFDRFDTPHQTLAPFAPVPESLRGAVRRVELPKGRKLIALTFDLCEQRGEIAGYDGAIVDYLRAQHVPATFFAGGKWMASHETRTRQLMSDALFEIANHGAIHRNLRLLQGADLEQEIAAPQRVYERLRAAQVANQCTAATGKGSRPIPPRITLFRFPYGACNPAAVAAVNAAGLVAIQWDVSTGDPSPGQSAAAIAEAMVRHARPGSIIINHANGRGFHTAEALPIAIPKLKAAGYEFVTVSALLAAGRPVVEQICYDNRPGDTDRYDHFFQRPQQAAEAHNPSARAGGPAWATTTTTQGKGTP